MRIGVLGGTFDPIHRAHLAIAGAALREYKLDEVWFMPAGDPYFKADNHVTPALLRLAMTKACIDAYGEPAFKCSDFEISDREHTYTAETFRKLKESRPDDEFFFILGLDSLEALDSWHDPALLLKNAGILCALRNRETSAYEAPDRGHHTHEQKSHLVKEAHAAAERTEKAEKADEKRYEAARTHLMKKYAKAMPVIERIDCPETLLSSTMIRRKAAEGVDLIDYVTPAVAKFIREHHLYM